MKLIVVDRAKRHTFQRLTEKFADDLDVHVVLDRRVKQVRRQNQPHTPERRKGDRRRLKKSWHGRDYIVIHVVEDPEQPRR